MLLLLLSDGHMLLVTKNWNNIAYFNVTKSLFPIKNYFLVYKNKVPLNISLLDILPAQPISLCPNQLFKVWLQLLDRSLIMTNYWLLSAISEYVTNPILNSYIACQFLHSPHPRGWYQQHGQAIKILDCQFFLWIIYSLANQLHLSFHNNMAILQKQHSIFCTKFS